MEERTWKLKGPSVLERITLTLEGNALAFPSEAQTRKPGYNLRLEIKERRLPVSSFKADRHDDFVIKVTLHSTSCKSGSRRRKP